jgi:hypothetical protein
MKYISVEWDHNSQEFPYKIVSEIGFNGFEIRKIEFFKNNTIGIATLEINTLSTMLAETPHS